MVSMSIGSVVSCVMHPRLGGVQSALGRVQVAHLVMMGRNWCRWDVVAVPKRSGKVSSSHRIGFCGQWNCSITKLYLFSMFAFRPPFLSVAAFFLEKNFVQLYKIPYLTFHCTLRCILQSFSVFFFIKELCMVVLRLMPTTCYFKTHYQINTAGYN